MRETNPKDVFLLHTPIAIHKPLLNFRRCSNAIYRIT